MGSGHKSGESEALIGEWLASRGKDKLVFRKDYEAGYGPLASEYGAAIFPYFALASGLLTGKYRTMADLEGAARKDFIAAYANDDAFCVVEALLKVADEAQAEPTTVALAWLLAKGVTAPIASVSRTEQLDALMAAPSLKLSDEQVATLDTASQPFA